MRQTDFKTLGDGQRTVLMLGTEGPVTRQSLDSPGLKVALFSLKRLGLIGKEGRTTPSGIEALRDGQYPIDADPIQGPFETNVRTLMTHWDVKRAVAIRRAVALQVKAIEDEQKGDS